jgi:DNA (cytosine-5)-methyltransferase 1
LAAELTHFSLFSGIGGFDLAAEWAGFRTVGQVEKNPYRQKVLRKYWPAVSFWEDIRDVTKETLANANIIGAERFQQEYRAGSGIEQDSKDRQRGDSGRNNDSVTLVTGGFPCQPVSVAEKQRGAEDDRWLWPEMLRVIKLLHPAWVVAENVTGLGHLVEPICDVDLDGEEIEEGHRSEAVQAVLLERVCIDLEKSRYEVWPLVIPACAVNAPHRRDRIWIVAHATGGRLKQRKCITKKKDDISQSGHAPDTHREGLSNCEGSKNTTRTSGHRTPSNSGWWEVEPDVGRVVDGVPSRVDRLAALGDAIVPQVAYQILNPIAEIERAKGDIIK